MTQQEIDEKYMRRCLQLAEGGLLTTKPNPMVGAVIVSQGGRILGEGLTSPCGGPHAEVNAFASVRKEDGPLLPRSTIYVSLEPCSHWGHTPPCCDLIISKRIRRCVVGCVDPFAKVRGRGISRMREAGVEVTVGVLEGECRWMNRRFITFNENRRPYILLKWAQTIDGYMAGKISTPFTRMLSHKLRAESDAILVGRGTLEADHPQLTTRHWTGNDPGRIVLSHHPDGLPHGYTWCGSIDAVISHLREERKQSLIVEGGARVHKAFMERGLWDEIRVETAPFLGNGGTKAPPLPKNAIVYKRESFDGNTILWLIPRRA